MTKRRKSGPRERSWASELAFGAACGILSTGLTGLIDRWLDRIVRPRDRLRERLWRRASPHQLAGPKFGRFLKGRRLRAEEERRARLLFSLAYGAGWGMVYAAARRRFPSAGRLMGVPFAIPFFTACDGVIAPLLKLTPTPQTLPARINAKEIGNHIAWTAAAEALLRSRPRIGV